MAIERGTCDDCADRHTAADEHPCVACVLFDRHSPADRGEHYVLPNGWDWVRRADGEWVAQYQDPRYSVYITAERIELLSRRSAVFVALALPEGEKVAKLVMKRNGLIT